MRNVTGKTGLHFTISNPKSYCMYRPILLRQVESADRLLHTVPFVIYGCATTFQIIIQIIITMHWSIPVRNRRPLFPTSESDRSSMCRFTRPANMQTWWSCDFYRRVHTNARNLTFFETFERMVLVKIYLSGAQCLHHQLCKHQDSSSPDWSALRIIVEDHQLS